MGRPAVFYEIAPHASGYYGTSATYWPNGVLDSLTLPWTPLVTYHPDGEGRIASVTAASGQNPASLVDYNTAGQVTGLTFGSGDGDSYQFDPKTGRMTTYQATVKGQADTDTLTWNANGTLASLAIADGISGSTDSQTCNYTHDDLGRVASVSCGSLWGQTFSSDPFGNVAKSGSVSWQASYAAATNHASLATYDGDGNVTGDGFHSYGWDSEGRMVNLDNGANLATYDALGRLVEESANSNLRFYFTPAGAPAGQDNTCCGIRDQYVWLPGGAKVDYNCCAVYYYYHSDWLGTARVVSGADQSLWSSQALAPYGEPYGQAGPNAAWAFTGQRELLAGGLGTGGIYSFPFRQYQPTQGRWLSPDPAGLAAVNPADPQTWNKYAYVGNQPLSATDPLGLMCPGGSCSSVEGEITRILGSGGSRGGCSVNGIDIGCAVADAVAASGNVDLATPNSGVPTITATATFIAPEGTSPADLAAAEQQWADQFGSANFNTCESATDSASGYSSSGCQVVALAIDSNGDPVLFGFQFFDPSDKYRAFRWSSPYSAPDAEARIQAAGYFYDGLDTMHGVSADNFRDTSSFCSTHFVVADPAAPIPAGTIHVDQFNPDARFIFPGDTALFHLIFDVALHGGSGNCPAL